MLYYGLCPGIKGPNWCLVCPGHSFFKKVSADKHAIAMDHYTQQLPRVGPFILMYGSDETDVDVQASVVH